MAGNGIRSEGVASPIGNQLGVLLIPGFHDGEKLLNAIAGRSLQRKIFPIAFRREFAMRIIGGVEDVFQPPNGVVVAAVLTQALKNEVRDMEKQFLIVDGVRTAVEVDGLRRKRM